MDVHLPELLPSCQLEQRLHDSQTFPKPPLFLLKGATAWLEDLYVPLCQDLLGVHCLLHQQEKGDCRSLSFAARRWQEKLSRHTQLLRKEKTCWFFVMSSVKQRAKLISKTLNGVLGRGRVEGAFCGYELEAK